MTEHARPSDSPVLEVRGLTKAFPGVRALAGVDFAVRPGEVHALMGENGAGKSTLMKILAGLQPPDAGEIRVDGRRVSIPHPHAAARLGIGMIHQELLPFPALTVAENILMGDEPVARLPGWVDRRQMRARARRLLARLDADLDPDARMGTLTVAQMQTVEIARALARAARVIIMDEPTSAISDREVEALFRIIRELRRDGVAVIYISHRMAEVFRVADRVTVLRDGRRVASQPVTELDEARLIRLMVGREVAAAPRSRARATGEVALEVRALGRRGGFRPLSFTLRRGEILGVAGLMGAGRTELLAALFGLAPADTGEIRVAGRPVRIRHPRDAYRAGIALVTEDRQASGVVPPLSVGANLTLANLRDYCRAGWIHSRREGRAVAEQIRRFAIRVADPRQRIRQLSGGNQQKVVLARALLTRPRVLLLDEPTRGIDVGAKAEIHALIGRLAADGLAILLVSSELPELMRLSDRLLVLREGELTGERRPEQTTPEEILALAMPAP